ncbi:MAG: ABC transporter ATP-binding protein [Bacillota bacterium]|nr:ABC transporter ATP-binding protein [Bacillota bacterium]
MQEYAIRTTKLTKTYEGKKVVNQLNLEVPRESVFAFLGPNGAGKTTTIKMLLGLTKPSEGQIEILGEAQPNVLRIKEKIGYIPDNPEFYGYMTTEELVSFCKKLYKGWDDGLVTRVLELMEISPKVRSKHLSRGQKAAVALALALGPKPELLILDEPATQFDPVKKQLFYRLLFEDVVGSGGTIFLATHQLSEVERFADLAAFINKGKLVMVKHIDELKISEKRIRVVFQGEEPRDLEQWVGVRRVERQGKNTIITVGDNLDNVWIKVSKEPHFVLELIDMDLEDIFIEHTGDGRPRM